MGLLGLCNLYDDACKQWNGCNAAIDIGILEIGVRVVQ